MVKEIIIKDLLLVSPLNLVGQSSVAITIAETEEVPSEG